MDRSNMKLDSKTYTEVAFIHVKQDKTTKLVGTTHTMLVINTPKSYPHTLVINTLSFNAWDGKKIITHPPCQMQNKIIL